MGIRDSRETVRRGQSEVASYLRRKGLQASEDITENDWRALVRIGLNHSLVDDPRNNVRRFTLELNALVYDALNSPGAQVAAAR